MYSTNTSSVSPTHQIGENLLLLILVECEIRWKLVGINDFCATYFVCAHRLFIAKKVFFSTKFSWILCCCCCYSWCELDRFVYYSSLSIKTLLFDHSISLQVFMWVPSILISFIVFISFVYCFVVISLEFILFFFTFLGLYGPRR